MWCFDTRNWLKHLNPLTSPEVLRQFPLSAKGQEVDLGTPSTVNANVKMSVRDVEMKPTLNMLMSF